MCSYTTDSKAHSENALSEQMHQDSAGNEPFVGCDSLRQPDSIRKTAVGLPPSMERRFACIFQEAMAAMLCMAS